MDELFFLEEVADLDAIVVPKRVAQINRVPDSERVEGTVLCDRLFRLPIHYNGKRSVICPGRDGCELHKSCRLALYFLCAVYHRELREVIWFQLPPNAAKALLFAAKTMNRTIYGLYVKIGRRWNGSNAPVTLSVDPATQLKIDMPKPLNPAESVKRCFFSDSEKTGNKRRKAV